MLDLLHVAHFSSIFDGGEFADGRGGHTSAPFEVACDCSGNESCLWVGPEACVHVFDELLLVIALVDGVDDVMELSLFYRQEDHVVALVVLRGMKST